MFVQRGGFILLGGLGQFPLLPPYTVHLALWPIVYAIDSSFYVMADGGMA